jgi:NUMOD4 motif/HNH endonuclease/Helix-turn-helix domain
MFEQIEFLERWRAVSGYEDLYEVSNWGRVRSLARTLDHYNHGGIKSGHTYVIEGKLLSPMPQTGGYMRVSLLSKDHKRRTARIAVMVAEAFIGPRPPGLHIDHKDGNKQNDCVWNLRYVTPTENMNAGNYDKNTPHGETHCRAKLSDADVVEIRRLVMEGMKQKEVAKMFGVTPQTVSRIARKLRRAR